MDRVNHLRGEAGGSGDSSLDSSPGSEAYLTANDTSKYFSLSEVDSSLDLTPTKDVSLSAAADSTGTTTPDQLSDLSPIGKKSDLLDSYRIGNHIEAANILSGGVDIFDDDNDNSCDGNELIIDDNVADSDDKSDELKIAEDSEKGDENSVETPLVEVEATPSMGTEVKLDIDGNNLEAIDIGNGLYLYRKGDHQEELAAVQVVETEEEPCYKFLKVRENLEGNLEVYEEITIEVPKTAPKSKAHPAKTNAAPASTKDNEAASEPSTSGKNKISSPPKNKSFLDAQPGCSKTEDARPKEIKTDLKTITTEAKISPLIGFTPMTFHSTPNKEGIPLTKTMVDQQLHSNRHSDNVKTIEVNTDSCKPKLLESPILDVACEISKENEKSIGLADSSENWVDKKDSGISSIEEDKAKSNDTSPKASSLQTKPAEATSTSSTKETVKDTKQDVSTKNEAINTLTNVSVESIQTENPTEKNNVTTEIKTLDKDAKKEDQKSPKKLETKHNDHNISSAVSSVSILPPNRVIDKNEPKAEPIPLKTHLSPNNISKVGKSSPNKIAFPNKVNDKEMLPEAASVPTENITVAPKVDKDQNKYQKIEENLDKEIKSASSEIDEQKNLSDDLIQLNDLGVVLNEKEKSFESVETKEPTVLDEIVVTSTVRVTKIENDTKITPSTINQNTTVKEGFKSLIARPHKISSTFIPLFTKTEQTPTTSAAEPKTKHIDNNAFVNKYVNKALLIKSVTSGPVKSSTFNEVKILNLTDKKEVPKVAHGESKPKSVNNNNAVPFGKWTEANKQAYLNKIKETKLVTTSGNTNQIKQPYDLNRRDILKKIDSQRQQVSNSNAARSLEAQNKLSVNKETPMFKQKSTLQTDTKPTVKTEGLVLKHEINKVVSKKDIPETITQEPNDPSGSIKDKRKDIHNQDIINRTIEDILIDRKSPSELQPETKPIDKPRVVENKYNKAPNKSLGLVDDIEMKMNELHGIPNDRCQETRLRDIKTYTKTKPYEYGSMSYLASKGNKIPSLVPISRPTPRYVSTIDIDEEEVLEHEPVTGDMGLKKVSPHKASRPAANSTQILTAGAKKDGGITEKDFDKFARRNSVTYNDDSIALTYESKAKTVVEDVVLTKYTIGSAHTKLLSNQKLSTNHSKPNLHSSKFMPIRSEEEYKSAQAHKFQIAYNSALTAMRHKESPINVIEDKPVKVVYMDPNAEFVASRLNVQGKELSPAKKPLIPEPDASTHSSCDSLDAEVLEVVDMAKSPEKSQTAQTPMKHQRKQVLTPVQTLDMEIVDTSELNSPKKKRKVDELKNVMTERNPKSVLPKKTYLLGRNMIERVRAEPQKPPESIPMSNAASAIDNLVKAAELLENQSKSMQLNDSTAQDNVASNTPFKRGRGRPRKKDMPESGENVQNKSSNPSPQKKPRVSKPKPVSSSEDSSDDDEAMVNWSMGKINENIVCPICKKLFRTENVVFKHVKHCTGPSPNRSETNTRSSRRTRRSFESNNSSQNISDFEDSLHMVLVTKKRNEERNSDTKTKVDDLLSTSKTNKIDNDSKLNDNLNETSKEADEVIVIEDTPIKNRVENPKEKPIELKTASSKEKLKQSPKTSNLVCEICGKAFRQLSYLVSHKMTHKKGETNKTDNETPSVFSCEVCKKDFRKLHHLVQHRIIHNPTTSRSRRKSSAEVFERKKIEAPKVEDHSAGFRCEPCDKSFRKLHHLVEHRETHDGINRQKTTSAPIVMEKEKTEAPTPQCNICNKTFRKLYHLIEHKEQHLEVSSEKSDDKSVKSSLSTRDIIHECSLCYMVFPNEHSLNKHSVNCQKKKRQSVTKPSKPENEDSGDDIALSKIAEEAKIDKLATLKVNEKPEEPIKEKPIEVEVAQVITPKPKELETKPEEAEPKKVEEPKAKKTVSEPENKNVIETIVIEDTPKKIVAPKDKVAATVTKRQKSTRSDLPVIKESKPSSDDDEIRYMFNPDFKVDDLSEGKFFMQVRANKRNSLQIERPDFKNHIKRRVSLQNPLKVPRLKAKKVELVEKKELVKPVKTESPSTDSDDSDVKYSFPEIQKVPDREPKVAKKVKRMSLSEKRKSLGGIAKRKTLAKPIVPQSVAKSTAVTKPARKRISVIQHRCDCGQLFSSAALLSRHTSLAHTPPRIRRNRSPPPDTKPAEKQRKSMVPKAVRKSVTKESKGRKSETNVESKTTKSKSQAETKTIKSESQTEAKSAKKSKSQVETKMAKKAEEPKSAGKKAETKPKPAQKPETKTTKRKSQGQIIPKLTARKLEIQTEPKAAKNPEESLVKAAVSRKSSTRSDTEKMSVGSQKSSVNNDKSKDDATPNKRQKREPKTDTVTKTKSGAKLRRTAMHAGVPVPEKMRKLMEKLKK